MYSRSYTKDEGRIKLPDNYNGTALLSHEDPAPEVIYTEPKRREIKIGVKPEVEIEERALACLPAHRPSGNW